MCWRGDALEIKIVGFYQMMEGGSGQKHHGDIKHVLI